MSVVWVIESVVLALHEEHLAEHGRAVGICDRGLLEIGFVSP
jgi:death-on-curing protein